MVSNFFSNKLNKSHYSAPVGVEELVGEVSLWLVELEVERWVDLNVDGEGGIVVGTEKKVLQEFINKMLWPL